MPAPLPPIDPNVTVPANVARQAAAAAAIHAQAYQTEQPAEPQQGAPSPTPEPAPQPAPQQAAPPPAPQPEPAPQPQAAPAPAPAPQPQPGADRAPAAEDLTPEQWRHRYLSMEGRYKQAAQSLGVMQEQMTELGDELMRHQDALQQARGAPRPAAPQASSAPVGLTPEEISNYGPELVDVIQRAARAAVMPDLQNVQGNVKQVGQRVQQVSQQTLHATLAEQIPNWQQINRDPRFIAWCNLPDLYSGQLRGNLLKAAFTAGHAARVVAFFKGFLAEEQATGQLPDPPVPQPVVPPRAPTIPLDMLAAPGRVRPAPGDNGQGAPVDKPIFTRPQIQAFYRAVQQGQYTGREQEKNATEQAIFLAQREGRVR